MRPLPITLALLALALGASPAARADVGALAEGARAADAAYVEALEALAKWCNGSKLFGKRDDVYVEILEFEPDHAQARKTLKYSRGGDGGWRPHPKYKRPRDWKPKLLDDFDARRQEALTAWRNALLRLADGAATSAELSWAAKTIIAVRARMPGDAFARDGLKKVLLRHLALLRTQEVPIAMEEVTAHLQAHLGDDPDVRRAFGEVNRDGRWLLPATVRAGRERQRILAEAKAALERVPSVQTATPTKDEGAAGGASRGVYVTEHMRVLGTTTPASLESIARSCEAAGPFFDRVFGVQVERAKTRTFFVFTELSHWTEFLEAYPPLSPAVRAHALTVTGSGYPLAEHAYACLPVGRPEAERDLCVDVTCQTLLNEAFAVWHAERKRWQVLPGWVRIGMSDYLTWRLIGTRILTTVGHEENYDGTPPNKGDRSPKADTKWFEAALASLRKHRAPGTHLMLGRDLSAFTKDDALTSFALSAWLVEGHPEAATKVLTEVGKGRKTIEVMREILHLSVEALHVELSRWLEETIAEAD